MAQRKLWLRNDDASGSVASGGFDVSEGIVRLLCDGLSGTETLGIEIRLESGGLIRWAPYAPCDGQLKLTATNNVLRIADTGQYRLEQKSFAASVAVLLQEDEDTFDAKIVYNVPVNSCSATAATATGIHPPLAVTFDAAQSPYSWDATSQLLGIPQPEARSLQQAQDTAPFWYLSIGATSASPDIQILITDTVDKFVRLDSSNFGSLTFSASFLARTTFDANAIYIVVNGVVYRQPDVVVSITQTPSVPMVGQLTTIAFSVFWNSAIILDLVSDVVWVCYPTTQY